MVNVSQVILSVLLLTLVSCAGMEKRGQAKLPNHAKPMSSAPSANVKGWNSANCAHITADGGCAHPL